MEEKQYLSLGDWLYVVIRSAESIPLFFRNLIAEFDKKQARFHKINLNLDSPESSRTFPGIFLIIPQNLLQHSPESSGTFPRIFFNIPRNLREHSPESF